MKAGDEDAKGMEDLMATLGDTKELARKSKEDCSNVEEDEALKVQNSFLYNRWNQLILHKLKQITEQKMMMKKAKKKKKKKKKT